MCKWMKFSNQKTKVDWIKKQDPYICFLQEIHFESKDTHILKLGDGKRYSMQMEIQRKLE